MMSSAEFLIDGVKRQFSVEGSPDFRFGKDEVLSAAETDITHGQPWYDAGYAVRPFLDPAEFAELKLGIEASVRQIVQAELGVDVHDFTLERYHRYVRDDAAHFKVVSKTRDLFANDFSFHVMGLIPRLERLLGFGLTDIEPVSGERLHIIVRINRPGSNDFNPAHKDIYEGVDEDFRVLQFVNFWIPVAGVTPKSSLPLAAGSHKLSENDILRTFEGAVVAGNQYRVRMVRSWAGDNTLVRAPVAHGQVLMFSAHLIHGLAVNDEPDQTRVALEFRLFKA
jgi:ectoine hydroxylase-related dioxygenase (phytanoyl-CoA dioxygenase family)